MFVGEEAAGLIHLVERFVDLEPKIGREFQGHPLGDKVPDLGLVATKRGEGLFFALSTKR